MNALYNHGLKQQQIIIKDLSSFEKNLSTSPLSLQGSITTSLTAFSKTVNEFNELVQQQSSDEKNSKQEARAANFNQELANFTQKFESLRRHRDEIVQETNKQELMGRRHQHYGEVGLASENPFDQQQSSSQFSYQEGLYNEKQSLSRGSQQLDQILEMGQQTLEDIVDQNETLRRARERFEESLVTLGVSRGTIRSVEKRARQDKWLFWGCFSLMLIAFWYITKLFR